MLFGRHEECRQLDGVLDDARDATSRTVIVRGEAGMGKSALLRFVANRAEDFEVSSAVGVESESDLPFAALLAICRPLLPFLDRLPTTQREALQAALALATGRVLDRFTAYAGALSLLAAAAEARPRLVLVDDLHWLDTPSAEALLFIARRLGPDRVAIVATARSGEEHTLDLRGLVELPLGGLDRSSSLQLLRSRYSEDELPEAVAARLIEATGGAPLALVEIPALLSRGQRLGEEPLPDPLPVGDSLREAFRREIESMPVATIEALLLLAAEDRGSMDVVSRALAAKDLDPDVLEPAERAHLIRVDAGHATFRHPLLRAAVYHHGAPLDRRAAHWALAKAYDSDDLERRTWQLAAACLEPDEAVAAALEASAEASKSRAAFGSAAHALERAADLTPHAERRARRLVDAAESAWRAGDIPRTERLLEVAESLTRDVVVLADVSLLRGRMAYMHGSATDTYEQLMHGAATVEAAAPHKAVAMLVLAAWAGFGAAELERALEAAERAISVANGLGGATDLAATVALAEGLMLRGRTRETRALLRQWKAAVDEDKQRALASANPNIGVVYLALEDYEFAAFLLQAFHAAAIDAPEVLPTVLGGVCQYEFRTGDWAAAYAHATAGVQLGMAVGQKASTGFILANLAIVEAGLGRDGARKHAGQVDAIASTTGFRSLRTYTGSALGLLDLGAGRTEPAIMELEEVDRMMRDWGVGDPSVVQWMPDLVEAYIRAGRHADAESLLERLSAQAEHTDGNWARATAARCKGLLTEEFDDHFAKALDIHSRMPTPFDRARTQLCYGERLRRVGRRVEARAQLRRALETFERLGASDWRKRAAAELGVSAERLSTREGAIDRMSPQELQVALLVAEGATNREAAGALFVTTKTVEFHLRNVYRKLGIRSRTELARVVATRRGVVPEATDAPSLANA